MRLSLQLASHEVWRDKYQLKDDFMKPIDLTIEDSQKRVAEALSRNEENKTLWKEEFLWALQNGALPAGRIWANAGAEEYKPATSLINCTVSQIVKDDIEGIMDANAKAGKTLSTGAGIGYEFSTLRPKGAFVKGAGAFTSGPLPFMDIFDAMCDTISSAGGRRGAQMGTFAVWHPDIFDFIKAKREDGRLRKFNLSVLIDDDFMEAVKGNKDYNLVFPIKKREENFYKESELTTKKRFWEKQYCKEQDYILTENDELVCRVYKTIKAKDLWNTIMQSTYDYAEPGFLLVDKINEQNNNWFVEELRATNPSLIKGTLVHTKKGIFPIEELENSRFQVRALDGTWGDAECWKSGDNEPTLQLTFNNFQTTTCTPKHKWPVLTKEGKLERRKASELKVGDKIPKNLTRNLEIEGDVSLTEEDGFFLGLWLADGSLVPLKDGGTQFSFTFNKQDIDLSERILNYVNALKEKPSSLTERENSNEFSFRSKEAVQLLIEKFQIDPNEEKSFPEIVWRSNDNFIKGFIDGFVSGDGYIQYKIDKNGAIRTQVTVTQKNKDIILNFSKLLSFYGMVGSITYRKTSKANFPNGKTYNREYERYDLKLSNFDSKIFSSLFSLTCKRKQNVLDSIKQHSPKRDSVKNHYLVIKSIESIEEGQPVWDVAVDHEQHLFPIQWGYTGNCGEQPLPPLGSCLLGSINLVELVENPFSKEASFNWDKFKRLVRIFTRMLDNVVEDNGLPLEGQRHEILYKRRHGMGFTGLGSMLSLLGISYGSAESLKLAREITKVLALEGFKVGLDLAKEKGPAPIFYDETEGVSNKKLWVKSKYLQNLFKDSPETLQQLEEHGCRFTHHSSIAPTGTISFSLGNNVSNGIEPTFAHKYTRNMIVQGKKAKVAVDVYSYESLLYKSMFGTDEIPEEFSTTDNITPMDHVNMQSVVQEFIDSSISKTINVPTSIPFSDFEDIYLQAYEKGLKGCTTFRFNPEALQGVLVRTDDLENTTYVFELEDGTEIKAKGNDMIEYEGDSYTAQNMYDAIKEGYFGKL